MLSASLHAELEAQARAAFGTAFRIDSVTPVSGGDINTTLKLEGPEGAIFAKLRPAHDAAMFAAEADGLQALTNCDAIRVPAVLGIGEAADQAFLFLEWLDMSPLRDAATARRAGAALAALHQCTGEHYGWAQDNFIGSTPQRNLETDNWSQFFVQRRLQPQFALAASKGFKGDLQRNGERIAERAPGLFVDYRPLVSLLHGDLWSGNLAALADGTPVLFDPACYFGDRDTDVAMSELFGGLPLEFYAAYRANWPLAEGYEQRKALYNLYHVLNHLNLFGGGYLRQAERMAAMLATELGR
ncbi:fructosamine kinase family protein [Uliginosibacterium aquaticum]|uniref:Fructosamine kinase family protein n=1 Tax=Uliginosibacterium aquaticum TaxID=2731212 RepID=A0ABX2IBA0_9RHOO|nr:fructosamine kinase family protein [Uliginosibacterium aquaticum]NSL53686.1 fructosamine kinase family protein [Uliginosibacterium aquaticum]